MGLIGITGKIKAGKDLLGGIIQYLLWHKRVEEKGASMHLSIDDFIKNEGWRISRNVSGWEIKKFADKLKEIACILIGCTRSQLEDREFKEKELEKEWWYYVLPGTNIDDLLTLTEYENLTDTQKSWCVLIKPTPRLLLQLLGTECGRQIIHPNIWVNALFVDYTGHLPGNTGQPDWDWIRVPKYEDYVYPNWIITDVRFPNEVEAIKSRRGIVIRKLGKDSSTGTHESETALDNTKVDYEIPYYENINDLIEVVREILIKEKIL